MEDSSCVKFISYTGKTPFLCHGILKLEIGGKPYSFGHEYYERFEGAENKNNLERFWETGGGCGYRNGDFTEPYIQKGEWEIIPEKLPEELQKYAEEIRTVFNENVQYGCCGGCIG